MTDNGLAALTTVLRDMTSPMRSLMGRQGQFNDAFWQREAAAILAPRGVFLPDGLGPVMVGMAKEIAALRAAHLDLCRLIVSYADLTHRVVAEGGELREISDKWTKVVSAARAALVAAKETP